MSRVPRIRFKGFEEDWEQRKLGEYLIQYTEVTIINDQYPVLTSSRKGIFFQKDYYDGNQIASENNIGYNIVPYGYFTYRHMSDDEIFYFNINNIIDNGIVSTLYPVFTTNNRLDSKFLQYELNFGREFRKYSVLQKQGGSRTYMYFNKLRDLKLTITTSLKEQECIRDLICSIDHLITLHQRKLEKLKIIKKSMLENLFPQNGEKTPKIRFSGFTEDWEQRKLGEIADKVVEKNFQLQERDVFTNSAEFGIIDQKDFFDHEIVNKNNIGGYYIVSPNDFVYNPRISVTAPVGPINRNKLCKRGIMSPLYTVFHPRNMNETFLEFYFRTNKWHKFMEYNGDSGARSDRFSIKTELFYAMTIPFPSHKEQSKVGICFESLDHLITLHQSKLEKLQKIKKSMLESMFV